MQSLEEQIKIVEAELRAISDKIETIYDNEVKLDLAIAAVKIASELRMLKKLLNEKPS